MNTQTTKKCPNCENVNLALMATLQKKVCTDCGKVIQWVLDKGQKSLLAKEIGK